MKFTKKGLIYNPVKLDDWRDNTFITPTPFLLNDDVIRVYGGFRDATGASRIGYIDVSASNPSEILAVSDKPVLDIGEGGMFDDNGVILGSIIRDGDAIRMYYVGFQAIKKAKFLAFSGLAESTDGGNTFQRKLVTPILDRYDNERYIRAIHTVIKEDGKYKIWYSQGEGWEYINGIPYPKYDIMYTESEDGINISNDMRISCVKNEGTEYRIGRPTVFKEDGIYKMFYTRDNLAKEYRAGYAESADGVNWVRKDDKFTLELSAEGWDSETVCYPVPVEAKGKKYVFYSGNGMGASGVGYAIMES
ncbi:hypothetical protein LRS05_08250 [Flavobacterium sp. J372]|uniref:hypothetical protein n=1 Tax=Flavobacterium sp. J372 TaxID=2898436 RepID=UPI002150F331|nr:hypothetical protein [Flavobacterium sp. J372]MCR5862134.1 hypothetical protein [Flavobacterium sp. J372]